MSASRFPFLTFKVLHKQKLQEQRRETQAGNTVPRRKPSVLQQAEPDDEDKNADINATEMASKYVSFRLHF